VIKNFNNLSSIKIIDFGLAIKANSLAELHSTAGTLFYQAPE
jgi:serine/threonine protein kinase